MSSAFVSVLGFKKEKNETSVEGARKYVAIPVPGQDLFLLD